MEINEGYTKTFEEALDLVDQGEAEITEKNGHHVAEFREPASYGSTNYCTCKVTMSGDKYSYRDIKIRVDDKTLHYYHQHLLYTLHDNGDIVLLQPPHHNKKAVVDRVNEHLEGFEIQRYRPQKNKGKWRLIPPKKDPWQKDPKKILLYKSNVDKVKLTMKEMTAEIL